MGRPRVPLLKSKPTPAAVAFGLFCAVFMFGIDALLAYSAVRQLWVYTYDTTAGKVLSNNIDRRSGKGVSYELHVSYSYRIGNDEYVGSAIRYGLSSSFRSESRASAAFPVGANVSVYYSPGNPTEAVLLRGLQDADFFWSLFLLPFNLVFGGFGLTTIVWLVVPAKQLEKWGQVPTGIRFRDDGFVAMLQYYSTPPWMAALIAACITAFAMAFLVGFGDVVFNPESSFAIWGWCGTLVAAAFAYWKVRPTSTIVEINQSAGQIILRCPGRLPRTFDMDDVCDVRIEETPGDSEYSSESSPPGSTFSTIAVLCDRGQGEEQIVMHTAASQDASHYMIKWMRERLFAS